jgi:hypothetical protein
MARPLRWLLVLVLVAWFGSAGPVVADHVPPPKQRQIERIIHDYLLEHPEVVIESSSTTPRLPWAAIRKVTSPSWSSSTTDAPTASGLRD